MSEYENELMHALITVFLLWHKTMDELPPKRQAQLQPVLAAQWNHMIALGVFTIYDASEINQDRANWWLKYAKGAPCAWAFPVTD